MSKIADRKILSLKTETKLDVLRKTAQIISDKFGIEVVFAGDMAYTDGKMIVVPSLPDTAPDDLVEALIGWVDHEVGHVRYTNFDEKRSFTDPDKRVKALTNAIEDIRQEWLMCQDYRGAGLNLESSCEWSLRKIAQRWDEKNTYNFNTRFNILCMVKARLLQGQSYAKVFYDEKAGELKSLIDFFEPRISKWIDLKTTSDAYLEAKEILRILDTIVAPQEEPEEPKEQQQSGSSGQKGEQSQSKSDSSNTEQSDDSGSDDEQGEQSDSDGAGDEKSEQEKQSGSGDSENKGEKGEEDNSGEQSGSGDSDDEQDEQNEPSSQNGGSDPNDGDEKDKQEKQSGSGGEAEKNEQSGANGQDQNNNAGGAGADEKQQSKKDASPLSNVPNDKKEEIKAAAAKMTNNVSGEDLHSLTVTFIKHDTKGLSGYRPYTTEFDEVLRPKGEGKLEEYYKLKDGVMPYINSIYTVLVRTLIADTRSRRIYGRKEGQINPPAISRLRVGDNSVFKTKRKGKDLDTYIEIIVDHSGSMKPRGLKDRDTGGKIKLATQTCIAISEALERLRGAGVRYGISGFTAGIYHGVVLEDQKERFQKNSKGSAREYSRVGPITEYVYKTGEEPLSKVRPLLSRMPHQQCGNNADGESIMKIAKRVMRRREKRKILLVLSDGLPNAQTGYNVEDTVHPRYMRKVADMIRSTPNLEVIGIGIDSDSVKYYYDRRAIVRNVKDLPAVAMGELQQALKGYSTQREDA